jgi:hypothetical protein
VQVADELVFARFERRDQVDDRFTARDVLAVEELGIPVVDADIVRDRVVVGEGDATPATPRPLTTWRVSLRL